MILIVLAVVHLCAHGSTTSADVAWAKLEEVRKGAKWDDKKDRADNLFAGQSRRKEYRDLGFAFFDKYPDDPRRWQWLFNTVALFSCNYIVDTPKSRAALAAGRPEDKEIDEPAKLAWERRFYGELKPSFMATDSVDQEQKITLCWADAAWVMNEVLASPAKRGQHIDWVKLHDVLIKFGDTFPVEEEYIGKLLGDYYSYLTAFGLQVDAAQEEAFSAAQKRSRNATMREMVARYEQIRKLQGKPLTLVDAKLGGGEIDLRALLGRVVLIDFWSTKCSTCIEDMDYIKPVYEHYKAAGFEVVGICFNDRTPAEEVVITKILSKKGVTWSQSLQGAQSRSQLARQWGITFTPTYFLLDKEGRLVTNRIDVKSGELESQVRRLLDLPPLLTGPQLCPKSSEDQVGEASPPIDEKGAQDSVKRRRAA